MLDIREKELCSGPTASFHVRKEMTQGDTEFCTYNFDIS